MVFYAMLAFAQLMEMTFALDGLVRNGYPKETATSNFRQSRSMSRWNQ